MPSFSWPAHPRIYEIPTWPWLRALSESLRRPVTLANVPDEAIAALPPCDAVWLMGVWERSPAGREIALALPDLEAEFRRALPDLTPRDVVGSPYAVHAYRVDSHLGGPDGLRAFRARLASRGIRLLLDYVPNHTAVDHAWTREQPQMFMAGDAVDLASRPDDFFAVGEAILAHGRDPYFPAWTDTAQINAFSASARETAVRTLLEIGAQCDGVRCDMAMLLLADVFRRTWGDRAGAAPAAEFWSAVIGAVRAQWPDFLWIAEAYWNLASALHGLGFDYCYDKDGYDLLLRGELDAFKRTLGADWHWQRRLVRFIENHDEPRAAAAFGPDRSRAAALLALTLPGARLVYAGQETGQTVKQPVQLGRAQRLPADPALTDFYRRLLAAAPIAQQPDDAWSPCGVEVFDWPAGRPWPLLAHAWRPAGGGLWVTVVNYGPDPARGNVRIEGVEFGPGDWTFTDLLTGRAFTYHGPDLAAHGLYVELAAWGGHQFTAAPSA